MLRTAILISFALLALVPAAARADEPRIAAGVSAGGTDVSGLTLAEAAGKLYNTHGFRLGAPLSTHVAGHRYILWPKDVGFVYDVNKSARRAYNAGIAPDRSGPVDVPLFTTYDKKKVAAYAAKVRKAIRRAPRNARVSIHLTRIGKVRSRAGRTISAKGLAKRVGRTLGDPARPRVMKPKLKRIKAKIRTKDLARRYRTIVTIDRGNFRLRLFKRLKLAKTYRVAVGQSAYPTPTGRFSVSNKAVDPAWTAPDAPWAGAYRNEVVPGGSAENPLRARWMGIVNGVGIHGTNVTGSIGTAASHGCIRMTVPDVIDLYPRVPVGTPVLIGN